MYFLYKNEHRIFKAVEIILRWDYGKKEKNRGDEPIHVITHTCMELSK
jgi:hypothetical protein